MQFITAQIFGAIGSGLTIIAGQMKDKKKYLSFYLLSYIFFIISLVLLNAFAGAINTAIMAILTIVFSKLQNKKVPVWLILIFVVLVALGNIITYKNIFSLLPAIASYIYFFILLLNNMKIVRKLTVILRALWMIYDFISKAYATFVLDIFSFISSIIAVFRYK